jgi:hypothetical protein
MEGLHNLLCMYPQKHNFHALWELNPRALFQSGAIHPLSLCKED